MANLLKSFITGLSDLTGLTDGLEPTIDADEAANGNVSSDLNTVAENTTNNTNVMDDSKKKKNGSQSESGKSSAEWQEELKEQLRQRDEKHQEELRERDKKHEAQLQTIQELIATSNQKKSSDEQRKKEEVAAVDDAVAAKSSNPPSDNDDESGTSLVANGLPARNDGNDTLGDAGGSHGSGAEELTASQRQLREEAEDLALVRVLRRFRLSTDVSSLPTGPLELLSPALGQTFMILHLFHRKDAALKRTLPLLLLRLAIDQLPVLVLRALLAHFRQAALSWKVDSDSPPNKLRLKWLRDVERMCEEKQSAYEAHVNEFAWSETNRQCSCGMGHDCPVQQEHDFDV
jgi:hypothetical protein